MNNVGTPETSTSVASGTNERLVLSREQMRRFLHGDEPKAAAGSAQGTSNWLHAGRAAGAAARLALVPIAQRHPLPLAGAALVVGGMLAWSRPWRWLLRPVMLAGIAAQITSRVVARIPVERLADAALALFTSKPPHQP